MPGKAAFSVPAIRELLKKRAEETSIRAVADELGMSPSGLHVFLQGSRPHPATRAKVLAWYVEHGPRASERRQVHKDDIDAAIELLAHYIREETRDSVRSRRFEDIAGRIAEKGKVPPG